MLPPFHEPRSRDGSRTLLTARRVAVCRCALSRRGQQHRVLRAHVLVRLLPRLRLLLGEPGSLHVGLDFLERGHAAGDQRVDEHEMPTEPGLDRSLPRPRRQLCDGKREIGTELLPQELRCAVAVVLLEHERIGEGRGEVRILGLPGELRQCGRRIVMRARPTAIGREIEMAETDARRQRELVAVRLVPFTEFLGRRLARGGDVLSEELHLLRHTALDDRVVLVDSERERFAIENLFVHLVFD